MGSHIDTVIDAGSLRWLLRRAGRTLRSSRPSRRRRSDRTPPYRGRGLHQRGGRALCPRHDGLARLCRRHRPRGLRWRRDGTDGSVLGEELAAHRLCRSRGARFLRPHAYVELHIEQGPVLERKASRSGRSKASRASPGSASPSKARPTTPARRRCRCAGMLAMQPPRACHLPPRSGQELEHHQRWRRRLHELRAERHQRHPLTCDLHSRPA